MTIAPVTAQRYCFAGQYYVKGRQIPIGQWNCRHTVSPVLLGISEPGYSDDQLEQFRQNSAERITVDGITKTRYEWSQEQRKIESAIRGRKDVANLAKASGDDRLRRDVQAHINQLDAAYGRISEIAGLYSARERMGVAGFRKVKTHGQLAVTKVNGTVAATGVRVSAGEHIADSITKRGLSSQAVVDALTKPLKIGTIVADAEGRQSQRLYGADVTVALNPHAGKLITAWPIGTKRRNKLIREVSGK